VILASSIPVDRQVYKNAIDENDDDRRNWNQPTNN